MSYVHFNLNFSIYFMFYLLFNLYLFHVLYTF